MAVLRLAALEEKSLSNERKEKSARVRTIASRASSIELTSARRR